MNSIEHTIKLERNNEKLGIINFLEKQLFRNTPVENEVCHLTYDMWKDLKETTLKGEIGQ